MTLSRRVNNISPFIRGVMRDDNRYQGGHIGFVTYADDDTYKVSYIEAGVRSDHVGAPLAQALGAPLEPLYVSSPAEYDSDLLRDKEPVTPAKPASKEVVDTPVVDTAVVTDD